MDDSMIERIKSIFLIILIIISIIQVGILWGYQSHGLPTGFLSSFFSRISPNYAFDLNKAKEEFRNPYKVVVSLGRDGKRWVVTKNNENYSKLCSNFSYYLQEALKTKPEESKSLSTQDWYNFVLSKKSFIFEFKVNIDIRLINWMYGIHDTGGNELTGVYKAALLPDENINENNMVMYITDGLKLYKYVLKVGGIDKKGLAAIIDNLSENIRLKTYSVIGDYFSGTSTRQDILYLHKFGMIKDNTYNFYNLMCKAPSELIPKDPGNISDRNQVAENFLGNENFESDIGDDGSLVFVNLNNVYRIYDDGLLQYRYKPDGNEPGKGSIQDAFAKTLEFLFKYNRQNLISNVDIILTNISEDKNSYKFSFDYFIDEIPVIVNYSSKGTSKNVYKNAITVEASGSRVISADWIIKDFEFQELVKYRIEFTEAHDAMVNVFRKADRMDVLKKESFLVNDINIGYLMENEINNEEILKPVWVFETNESGFENIIISLQK